MSDRGDRDRRDSDAPSLEERNTQAGAKLGDRRVRIVRPAAGEFRRRGGHYIATPRVDAAESGLGRAYETARRILFGARLTSEEEAGERLSKKTGLAIMASDNISSSAYATEEAMRVLAIAGGAALALTMPIAIAVCVVLAVVILSESRVIRAYPNGGGSYIVAKDNHGVVPGLIAASALLIDYVLTVAVSSAAGVAAISSFVPAVHDHRVLWAVGLIALLTIGNLRGIREAGVIFAAPTYIYVISLLGLVAYGLFRIASGDMPVAVAPRDAFEPQGLEALTPLIVLRAFASGSVGLTGSEAIANGVPNFKPPEPRNAVITLVWMGTIFGTLFLGITYLATRIGIVPDASELETVNSMLTRSVVGESPFYLVVQISTAIILLLAANTGFSGFPRLASVLADDRFMPRQFAFRGERLAFSFGIVALALMSAAVLAAFHGSVTELVPLYTIGVFVAFTLSQSGLVRRWWRLRNPGWRLSMFINTFGTIVTGTVLVVVAYTKFFYGAWMVLVVMPVLVALLYAINRHYRTVHDALILERPDEPIPVLKPPVVLIPVARLDRATLQAVAFARSISPTVRAVHIASTAESAEEFARRWRRWTTEVPLDVIESPYRSLLQPLLRYIERIDERDDRPITVVLAEFVPRNWWEWILHSQTALRLKLSLLFRPNTIVIDVPYHSEDPGHGVTPRGPEDPSR
ncbi:MAG TPA: APC family permease [Candidatus Limnocylindria bacterium]|jgi:amino acid transporter|nr:APC family permease [Candidatus Limnocylindria bacterium]